MLVINTVLAEDQERKTRTNFVDIYFEKLFST